jgi:succinate dehydrogenase/fumarate reductase flavoprotein subunit
MADSETADAVVVGAGMAGLVAGLELAESGADVTVLEKAPTPGGSMRISNGIVWTYGSFEELRERSPDGEPALQRLLVDRIEDDLAWLESVGADLVTPEFDVPGPGKTIDPPAFTDHMVERIEAAGGSVRLEMPLDSLAVEDGTVVGVEATGPDGKRVTIDADAVVVATGGFQGNEQLVEQHVTDATENLYLRSNPWSTGDGLLAATEVGGKTTAGLGTFYGHTMAAPPADISPDRFADATQYYGFAAVALDRTGERFTDESESALEETLTQDIATETDGRAYYVFDETIADRVFGSKTADEIFETAGELGGRTALVDSLSELGATLEEWGVDGDRAIETVEAFNDAIEGDERLHPSRENERIPIDEPPYRLVEVQPSITFTMGGVAVDESMAVKRRSASPSGMAISADDAADGTVEGLFAAGSDVGAIHRRRYVGGLAVGLVSGRIAARSALERIGNA